MARRKTSPRRLRRTETRAHESLVRDLERLARLQPGGAPERPLVIESPALVEVVAGAVPCPLCGGTLRLDEHTAETVEGIRLRVAYLACTLCGTKRQRYFRLVAPPA